MNDTHPDTPRIRSNRVRTYVITRRIITECVGSSLYSLERYLIVDNATEGDAGTYLVNVTTPQYNEIGQVNVSIGKYIIHYTASLLHVVIIIFEA